MTTRAGSWIAFATALLSGCGGEGPRASSGAPSGPIVVHSALEREFAEPVLEAYEKQSGGWADRHRGASGTWYGFAARARILVVNTKLVAEVAQAAGSGQIAFGLTDTDDATGELDAGNPVAIVHPDREPNGLGTLFIPNTLSIVEGAPHPKKAEAVADHVSSPQVEAALANGPSAQIPLVKSTQVSARVESSKTVHAMEVDFEAAAGLCDKVAAFLAAEFGG